MTAELTRGHFWGHLYWEMTGIRPGDIVSDIQVERQHSWTKDCE